MTAEYFLVGGKLTAVVGQLTALENFLCGRSTVGFRKFHKFCRSSDVDPILAFKPNVLMPNFEIIFHKKNDKEMMSDKEIVFKNKFTIH